MAEVVIGTQELMAKFDRLAQDVQGQALVNTVQAGATVVVNAAKNNISDQGLIRTRNLSRSIHSEVAESSPTMARADVGTNLEYAAIHEFGGTITAKKSKFLAIPVGSYTGSPREHSDLKLRKTANGWIMVDASGAAQYVLKTSVEIPAQPYLRPALDEHQDEVINTMASAFKQAINKAVAAE